MTTADGSRRRSKAHIPSLNIQGFFGSHTYAFLSVPSIHCYRIVAEERVTLPVVEARSVQ
jgi:hypothetical protein